MHRLVLSLVFSLVASAAAAAPVVGDPWSRPAVAGATGAGFMVLRNPGAKDDALLRVESPVAARVEVHRSSMTGGIMSMQKLDRLPLPAGGAVTFAPGGNHVMFVGLKRTLKTGDSVPATLVFESGARVSAAFKVQVTAPAADHHHH